MKKGLWMPAEILRIEELNATEKIILSVIFSFSQGQKGVCNAKNNTIAEAGGVSLSAVSHYIPAIKKKGYLAERGTKQARELIPIFPAAKSANFAEHQKANFAEQIGKPCRTNRQTLPNKSANFAEPFIYKETVKKQEKKQGYISPAQNLKNEEEKIKDGEAGNAQNNERFLSDFWKQELGL